jgi:hypothetical protein
VTDPAGTPSPPDPPTETTSAVGPERTGRAEDPPRSFAPSTGRAASFRRYQSHRRSTHWERIGELVVVAVILVGAYAVVTARWYAPNSEYEGPSPGPNIVVHFGPPSVTTVACTAGGTAYVERVPWVNSTQPLTTGAVNVRVYEIADGDYVGDPNVIANASSSNLCVGDPPSAETLWYAVLAGPDGVNLLTYTVDAGWAPVVSGPSNVAIANGSTVFLVTQASYAGTGRGLAVYGFVNESSIVGSVAL